MAMRHGAKRLGVKIDMTPMVDVAFLLLIFFMLTTQFKPPEKKEIKLPESHSELKVPQSKLILLSISDDGNMLMQFPRVMVDANKKPVLDRDGNPRITTVNQDETIDRLQADLQTARLENPSARMVIKTDRRVNYGVMEDVMKILQETNTTTFNVVTELSKEKVK
jgi:biopolymer transport protein ExbD